MGDKKKLIGVLTYEWGWGSHGIDGESREPIRYCDALSGLWSLNGRKNGGGMSAILLRIQ